MLVPTNAVRNVSAASRWPAGSDRTRQLFSLFLNRSFLRILCCGGAIVTDSIVDAYSKCVQTFSVEQKRMIADSGAWPILIALLRHENASVVNAASEAMQDLAGDCDGEDYARFIEEDLFGQILKNIPSPVTDVARALIKIAVRAPLPDCCAPVTITLDEQVRKKMDEEIRPWSSDTSMDSLKVLSEFARSRGLAFCSFVFTGCVILLSLQPTTRCFSQLGVTSPLSHSFPLRSRQLDIQLTSSSPICSVSALRPLVTPSKRDLATRHADFGGAGTAWRQPDRRAGKFPSRTARDKCGDKRRST
jgi:hypothetical protein